MNVTVHGTCDVWGFRRIQVFGEDQKPNAVLENQRGRLDCACSASINILQHKPSGLGSWGMPNLRRQVISQGIYEEILLASGTNSITGDKESVFWRFIHSYFMAHPHLHPEGLHEIGQAATWAEALDASMLTLEPEIKIAELGNNVAAVVKNLAVRRGCIIPTGPHATLRIQRNLHHQDSGYEIELFSRSRRMDGTESIALGGKKRVRCQTFTGLSLSQVSDPNWLILLLKASLKSTENPSPLNEFLVPLKNFLATKDSKSFHSVKRGICRIQNLWDLFHERLSPVQSRKNLMLRKLELNLEVLFGYFYQIHSTLKYDSTAFTYLKEGQQRTSRLLLAAGAEGFISDSDLAALNGELQLIDNKLRELEMQALNCQPPGYLKGCYATIPVVLPKLHAPLSAPSTDHSARGSMLPAHGNLKKIQLTPYHPIAKSYQSSLRKLPHMDAHNCLEKINKLNICMGGASVDLAVREQYAVDFFLALPLDPSSKAGVWNQLSIDDRIKASALLTKSIDLFRMFINTGSTLLPDRILALVKVFAVVDYLARLNKELTKLTQYRLNADLLAIILDLYRGSSPSLHHDFRSLIAPSVYKVRTYFERSILLQLKAYCEWHLPSEFTHHYTSDFDENRNSSSWRGLSGNGGWGFGNFYSRDIEIDLTSAPYKHDPQCRHLHTLRQHLRELLKIEGSGMINLAEWVNSWGRPIDHPLFQALAYAFKVEKGELSPFEFSTNSYTPEAIMDDPWTAVERAYGSWQSDLGSRHAYKRLPFERAKAISLRYFTDRDLQALLLASSNEAVLWSLLGLMKQNVLILANSCIQGYIEHLILQKNTLTWALGADPTLPEYLNAFFTEQVKKLERLGEIPIALFMVQLCSRIRCAWPPENEGAAVLPDFIQQLKRWLESSSHPESPLQPYRYALLSELLDCLGEKEFLSHSEIKDYIIYYSLWIGTPPQLGFDPVHGDFIQRLYEKWQYTIIKIMKDPEQESLREHLLNTIAADKGLPLGQWEGNYPLYFCNGWKMNIDDGSVSGPDSIGSIRALPASILKHPLFIEAFPHFSDLQYRCSMKDGVKTVEYRFKDRFGVENLIENKEGEISIYKASRETSHEWVQYIPKAARDHHEQGALDMQTRLYLSTKSSTKAFVFHTSGQPEFEVDLAYAPSGDSLSIYTLKNINAERKIPPDFLGTLLDPVQQPAFKAFLALGNSSEIILWSKNGVLQQIEFYGSNLIFKVHNGEFYCQSGNLAGYRIDFSASVAEELPIGLLLVPNQPSGSNGVWLLPHFSGSYILDKKKPAYLAQVTEMLKSYWTQNAPSVEWAKDDHFQWHFAADRKPEFWTFDLSLPLFSLLSPDPSYSYKSYFDLFLYCMQTIQIRGVGPVAMAKECLRKLSALAPHKAILKDLEAFISEVLLTALPAKEKSQGQRSKPEALGLALSCLLTLYEKGNLAFQAAIEKQIIRLIPSYFAIGRQIDLEAKLPHQQEMTCLLFMKKHRLAWFQKHVPLIVEPRQSGLTLPLKQRSFQHAPRGNIASGRPLKLCYEHVRNYLVNGGQESEENSPEGLLPGFRKIYLLSDTDPKNESFIAMFYRIKHASSLYLSENPDASKEILRLTGGYKKVSGNSISTSYRHGAEDLDLLLEYLEALFDIKAVHPELRLPPLPRNNEQIDVFCKTFTSWVEKYYPKISEGVKPSVDRDLAEAAFEKVLNEILKEKKPSTIAIPFEELEKRLQTIKPADRPAITVQLQLHDPLISLKISRDCFTISQSSYPFHRLDLDSLKQKNKKNLTALVKELEAEIAILTSRPRLRYTIKNNLAVHLLLQDIRDAAFEKSKSSANRKLEIEKLLAYPSTNVKESIEIRVGYRPLLSWDEIVVAFLQQDFTGISRQLPMDSSIEKVKKQFEDYFKEEIQCKYAHYVCGEIDQLLSNGDITQAESAVEEIHTLLTRRRCFDPEVHPELLAMEYLLGFIIREDQLEMVADFINKPNSIRRAPTGAGKTSVIMPLIGLMKANGTNLVTIKFLNSQFNRNWDSVSKLLGSACKKKIIPFLFSAEMPLTYEQQVNGSKVVISLFQKFYEDLLSVIISRGCVVTDKKSEPLLKAKMIEIYDRLSALQPEEQPAMELEHLHWLGKILCLLKEREETIYDEFDKFLAPLEEFHFRISEGKPLPRFISETVLSVYDTLLGNPVLSLTRNTQAELPKKDQEKVLFATAATLAEQWMVQKEPAFQKQELVNYLLSALSPVEETLFLTALEKDAHLSLEDRDKLSLQKDLITKFLRTALFKAADHKYICSQRDGKSVIPTEYADCPKEGSEFEDVRLKLCYLIQYYYQRGISYKFFEQWVHGLRAQAVESIINGEALSFAETIGEMNFKDYFPNHSLERISQESIQELYQQFQSQKETSMLRKFLNVVTQEQKLPGRKISLTPHNEVSIAKTASGTSATKGCLEGLHRIFDVEEHLHVEQKHASNARMLARFLERVAPDEPILYFDQGSPQKIVSGIVNDDPLIKVVIDGSGTLRGMDPSTPAKQLLENQKELKGVSYFDRNGLHQTIGMGAEGRGVVFSHAQSRGADLKIPLKYKAALLANGRTPQEEVFQNEGRLRREDQKMRIALPKGSPITDLAQLINANLEVQAEEYGSLLFISKQQEMHDIVHADMSCKLASYAAGKHFSQGFNAFKEFQKRMQLVSDFEEEWDKPGGYYAKHGAISRPKEDNVEQLNETKQFYLEIAKGCNLSKEAIAALEAHNPESYAHLLPENAYQLDCDREIQVETEIQTEVTTELFLHADAIAHKPKMPFYLPWRWKSSILQETPYRTLFPSYDDGLSFSVEFLPLARNVHAPQMHRRQPHDMRQLRLHYIEAGPRKAAALDPLEVETALQRNYGSLYDTKTNRFIRNKSFISDYSFLDSMFAKQEAEKLHMRIAQMRFEDGQYSGYPPEEWEALKRWIREHPNPKELEVYFRDEVLKFRPQDRERYAFSPLRAFLDVIIRLEMSS